MQQNTSSQYKCILTGDLGVGKSYLIYRIVRDTFGLQYRTKIEPSFYTKDFNLKGKNIQLQIWDTAGAERFTHLPPIFYRGTSGVFLVYDITNRESFNNVARWLLEAKENCDTNVHIILIGNKFDQENERVVSYEEGEGFAKEKDLGFFEVSTKTPYNVTEAWTKMAELVYKPEKPFCDCGKNHKKSGVELQGKTHNTAPSGNCAC